jgi:hypothetical protein
VRYDAAKKEDRKQRGENRYITDHISSRAGSRSGSAFLHLDRRIDQSDQCSEIGRAGGERRRGGATQVDDIRA